MMMTHFLSLKLEWLRLTGQAFSSGVPHSLPLSVASAVASTAATNPGSLLASVSGNLNQVIMLVVLGLLLILAIFAVLAVVISMVNYQENPVRDRLNMFKENGIFEKTNRKVGAFDDLTESLMILSGPIGQKLYGSSQKQIKTLLTEAGEPDTDDHVGRFMAKRAAVGLVCAAVLLVVALLVIPAFTAVGALGGFVIGSMIPRFNLLNKAKSRKNEIRFNLPDTLDLMVVCVEAGLALDATIQRVADESERMAPEISMEFKRLNKELNAGISRIEAFHSLGIRAGVDELRSLCAMIIQADKMGTSVADTLRIFSEDLRTRRRQQAEELASQASIKMILPLVFFIFPPLFMVLLGPMGINVYHQFFSPP
jgi:tight adherence protein C